MSQVLSQVSSNITHLQRGRAIKHPQADEYENLVVAKRQLEWMVQATENDDVRESLLEALHVTNRQIMYIKNRL